MVLLSQYKDLSINFGRNSFYCDETGEFTSAFGS